MAKIKLMDAEGKGRIFVLVFDAAGELVRANVQYTTAKERKPQTLEYNESLQRYGGSGLPIGPCTLTVRGPRGTAPETRTVDIHAGDNHVSVMVAPPGMPSIPTAEGGSHYFDTQPGNWLLHVWGKDVRQQVTTILRTLAITFTIVETSPFPHPDDVVFELKLGAARRSNMRQEQLRTTLVSSLDQMDLHARLSLPAYTSGQVAFGITDEIVVRFRSSTTRSQISAFADRYGLQELRPITWMGNAYLFRFPGYPSLAMLERVKAMNSEDVVVYAEHNIERPLHHSAFAPNDYLYPETPHLKLIGAEVAWDTIHTQTSVPAGGSPDIVIGVLDNAGGVDPLHPDISGLLSDGSAKQIANFDFLHMMNQTSANLPADHGTQCAGSATGRFNNNSGSCGVAPNCKLIGAQFKPTNTDLEIADIWVWMAGFPTGSTDPRFPPQLAKGADVISNSWGSKRTQSNQIIRDVLDFLTTYPRNGRGVVMVCATGNWGYVLNDNNNPFASDPKVIAVGASINSNPTNPVDSTQDDPNGQKTNLPAAVDTRAYYSPYGMTVDIVSPSNTCFDPNLVGLQLRDPVMAPVRSGMARTLTTAPLNIGNTVIPVQSVAGFSAGMFIAIGVLGTAAVDVVKLGAVGTATLTVAPGLARAHPVGTPVLFGLGDWPTFPVSSTYLSANAIAGDVALPVTSTAGFAAGDMVLVGDPGVDAETLRGHIVAKNRGDRKRVVSVGRKDMLDQQAAAGSWGHAQHMVILRSVFRSAVDHQRRCRRFAHGQAADFGCGRDIGLDQCRRNA